MFTRNRDASLLGVYLAVILVSLLVPSLCSEAQPKRVPQKSPSQASVRYFTVRDSIEMARFGRGEEPIFSPDGKYFAVVTSRGIIDSDKIESTLRVFKSRDVERFLQNGDGPEHIAPKVVANVAAVPNVDYVNSYEPIISNVQWSGDSKTILFLGQKSQKERQLYQADLISGSVRRLTSPGYDVSQFDIGGATIAYRAARSRVSLEIGQPINADARDVAGVPLGSLLFGDKVQRYSRYSELWVSRAGQNSPVTDPLTKRPIRLLNSPAIFPGYNPLSVSPDGRSAIVLEPSTSIPLSWESYVPAQPSLKLNSKDPNSTADSNWGRPTEYAQVALDTGEAKSLLSAPSAFALGYGAKNMAVWSPDGRKVLLTNTYLPLDSVDESERSKRLVPCTVALVDLVLDTNSCVVFSKGDLLRPDRISFGESDSDVICRFRGASVSERYHNANGSWQIQSSTKGNNSGEAQRPEEGIDARNTSDVLSVEIRQDLNTPPVLWGTNHRTGGSKKLWDPNPQLAKFNLGEASVFHWKDKSGYEWNGGLVKPPNYIAGKAYPLVIQSYGFNQNEFVSDGYFTTAFAARPLAAHGMVVLQMQNRQDRIATADEAPDNIRGYEAAIDSLASEGLVDPKKVGIIGFSRSCYSVESALIQSPARFAAATIAEGVDESYMQALLFFDPAKGGGAGEGDSIYGGKPFGDGLRLWLDRAPGFHLDRVKTPVRIEAHGPWSILGEWEIYASLWRQGKPVDFIQIPDGQHILQKPLERMASQQGNVDWFRFWLKGEEDTDPLKARQYALWRQLRNQRLAKNEYP